MEYLMLVLVGILLVGFLFVWFTKTSYTRIGGIGKKPPEPPYMGR